MMVQQPRRLLLLLLASLSLARVEGANLRSSTKTTRQGANLQSSTQTAGKGGAASFSSRGGVAGQASLTTLWGINRSTSPWQVLRLLSKIEGARLRSSARTFQQGAAPHSSLHGAVARNASFTPLWGSNHTYPWRVIRRNLKSRCFSQHPAWLAYKAHVHKMRLGQAPERYLYWRTGMGQGIGNNLQGIETALYVAMASGRWLKLGEASGGDTLESIFGIRNIDWRMSTHDGIQNPENVLGWYDFSHPTKAELIMEFIQSDERDIILETNAAANGVSNPFLPTKLTAIGFPNMTLLDRSLVKDERLLPACAFHSIFALPQKLLDFEELPPGPRLGIHLRFGDKVFSNDRFGSEDDRKLGDQEMVAVQAVTCAQQLASQMGLRSPCVVVVESDSHPAKEAAAALDDGGLCKVWTSSSRPTHTFVSGDMEPNYAAWARLTAVEMLLHTSSTFGFTAGAVGVGAVEPHRMRFLPDLLPKAAGERIECRL